MFLVPAIFAFGKAAVRSARDVAFAPPECGRCDKVALARPAPGVAPRLAPALTHAARPALARAARPAAPGELARPRPAL